MNRFIAAGLLMDAAEGRQVIATFPDGRSFREAFILVEDTALRLADRLPFARVLRSVGSERIVMCSGGWLRMVSGRNSLRGLTADVVYVDDPAAEHQPAEFVVASRPGGEVVRSWRP